MDDTVSSCFRFLPEVHFAISRDAPGLHVSHLPLGVGCGCWMAALRIFVGLWFNVFIGFCRTRGGALSGEWRSCGEGSESGIEAGSGFLFTAILTTGLSVAHAGSMVGRRQHGRYGLLHRCACGTVVHCSLGHSIVHAFDATFFSTHCRLLPGHYALCVSQGLHPAGGHDCSVAWLL